MDSCNRPHAVRSASNSKWLMVTESGWDFVSDISLREVFKNQKSAIEFINNNGLRESTIVVEV